MTAQQLLNELLDLQKQGFDLDELDVRATKLKASLPNLRIGLDESFLVLSTEVDDFELILYND